MANTVVPNTYQKPNIFVDEIMRLLSPTTNMVLDAACRRIMGWEQHRVTRRDRISLTQFREMTGLNRTAIMRAIAHLRTANILTRVGEKSQLGQEYELNLGQHGAYNWDWLRDHAPDRRDPGVARTAKQNKPADGDSPPVAGEGGLSDRPPDGAGWPNLSVAGGLSHRPQVVYEIDTQNKETKKDNPIYLLWSQQALPLLRNRMPASTFLTWMADAQLEEDQAAPGFYTIRLPAYLRHNPNVGEWVKSHLGAVCVDVLRHFAPPVYQVAFDFQESTHEQAAD